MWNVSVLTLPGPMVAGLKTLKNPGGCWASAAVARTHARRH
jgi:hypothetical protein